jgi:hypothetical protein
MKLEEIEQILNHYHAAKEIYKLHLEDKIKFYKEIESYWIDDNMDEMPNYLFYLKEELKSLENDII